ncbi:MAG: hypothetical protein M9927_24580 [Anaerolineae bacterium]|nr:hypothetical protein [Anaerolineae bacterium]
MICQPQPPTVRRVGIVVFNEDGIQITENSVGGIDTNESADAIGIGTQGMDATTTASGVTNAFVSRNKVNGVNSAPVPSVSQQAALQAGAAGGANTYRQQYDHGRDRPVNLT